MDSVARVERMNGTLREQVQRGWKSMKTTLAEGQTPADAAGIGVQGEQKWLALLKNALQGQPKN